MKISKITDRQSEEAHNDYVERLCGYADKAMRAFRDATGEISNPNELIRCLLHWCAKNGFGVTTERHRRTKLTKELARALDMLLSIATDGRSKLSNDDPDTDIALLGARQALAKARAAGLLKEPLTPIVAVGSGRLDHPSGVLRLERRTIGEESGGDDWYQSLISAQCIVDGDAGMLIDINTSGEDISEAGYYLTAQEARLLATWLTMRTLPQRPIKLASQPEDEPGNG
jgi:hypothetical protein